MPRDRIQKIRRRHYVLARRRHIWRPEDELPEEPFELSLRSMQSAISSGAAAARRPSQLRH